MVRKQLYITERQDRELKRRARETGISEAEIVRRALDESLQEDLEEALRPREVLARLLDNTRDLAKRHQLPSGYRFDRDELYNERENRRTTPS